MLFELQRSPDKIRNVSQNSENFLSAPAVIEWKGNDDDNEILATQTETYSDHIYGYGGNDTLRGYAGADTLEGGEENDILDGGAGFDRMYGGNGDDTYYVDHLGDQVLETDSDTGDDTVVVSASWVLRNKNIERLVASNELVDGKPKNLNLIVSVAEDRSQTLIGNDGDNLLDGGTGIDTLRGGKGDDTYRILHYKDVIEELESEGTDKVISLVNFTLGAGTHVEVLELFEGRSVGSNLTGNEFDNKLIGNSHGNLLDGSGGMDTLAGGHGDDTYIIDHAKDVIEEASDGGTDKAISSTDYTLGSGVHIETLAAAAGHSRIGLTGNELNNTLIGNDGGNVLSGGLGADTLDGGSGIDQVDYSSSNISVAIDLQAGKGLGGEAERDVYFGIENARGSQLADMIVGNAGGNTLWGEGGDDTLDGGAGVDHMEGGAGNDTYFIDGLGDRIIETVAGGHADKIVTSVSYSLASYVENLVALGSGAIMLTGNTLNNSIYGNQAKNILNGGKGNDRLDGGFGNDALNGGSGNDFLCGGAGKDTLRGEKGKDLFVFNAALDKRSNVDMLVDFNVRDDIICLDKAVFKKLGGAGKLKKKFFVIGNKAEDRNDHLIYKQKTGQLFYDPDGSGREAPILFAKLSGGLNITADDFRII